MTQQINNKRPLELIIHIIGWGIFFSFPFFFMNKQGTYNVSWMEYIRHSVVPVSFLLIFYANYFFLIPKFFFSQEIKKYIIINIILIVLISVGIHFWQEVNFVPKPEPGLPPMNKPEFHFGHKKYPHSNWFFVIRDAVSLTLTIALSLSIKMSYRWMNTETARREAEQIKIEAEKSKTEAELRNLKDQLNPHFLLNTLNNIYALIAFSPDKAQQAVHDLSKLLRYVLYDNNQTFVLLTKEVDFMKNYIELMKIRLSDNVRIDVNFSIPLNSATKVAPLLFISLIENAFKHGISYSSPSFIDILLEEHENGTLECQIRNSYFPKNENDKSGSGIGLESLQKRLDLLYPEHYTWEKGIKDNVYTSTLVINNELSN